MPNDITSADQSLDPRKLNTGLVDAGVAAIGGVGFTGASWNVINGGPIWLTTGAIVAALVTSGLAITGRADHLWHRIRCNHAIRTQQRIILDCATATATRLEAPGLTTSERSRLLRELETYDRMLGNLYHV